MAVNWVDLELGYLTDAAVTKYTCPAGTKAKPRVNAHNNDSSPIAVTVHIIPSGGSLSDANMGHEETINAGESYSFPELEPYIMGAGAVLQAFAGTTNKVSFGGGVVEKV